MAAAMGRRWGHQRRVADHCHGVSFVEGADYARSCSKEKLRRVWHGAGPRTALSGLLPSTAPVQIVALRDTGSPLCRISQLCTSMPYHPALGHPDAQDKPSEQKRGTLSGYTSQVYPNREPALGRRSTPATFYACILLAAGCSALYVACTLSTGTWHQGAEMGAWKRWYAQLNLHGYAAGRDADAMEAEHGGNAHMGTHRQAADGPSRRARSQDPQAQGTSSLMSGGI